MSLIAPVNSHTVYQDVNRHTTIVSHVEGTRKIVVKHCPMGGSLDVVSTPLDSFVEQFPQLMDYDAQKAASVYLAATVYIPTSDAARLFLSHLSKGTEMPIKTVADASAATTDTNPAPAPVVAKKVAAKKVAAKTVAPAADTPAADTPVASKKAPAKKVATKVAAPAPAPAAKKVAAKKAAADKPAKVSAADRKAAQAAIDGKRVLVIGDEAKAATQAMKAMAAFVSKKEGGITWDKLFEKFSKEAHAGVTKMNINWGLKIGVFKFAK